MSGTYANDPMMEMYLFETNQLVNRLEQLCMISEKTSEFKDEIPEIFRIMHTIKGNSMMMLLEDIGKVAHRIEDLFDYLKTVDLSKKNNQKVIDFNFEAIDFFKGEVAKLENQMEADGDSSDLVNRIEKFVDSLKNISGDDSISILEEIDEDQKFFIAPSSSNIKIENDKETFYYYIKLFFNKDAQMENIRAFSIVHNLKEIADIIDIIPSDIVENEDTIEIIKKEGFQILFSTTEDTNLVYKFLNNLSYVSEQEISKITYDEYKNFKNLVFSKSNIEKVIVIEDVVITNKKNVSTEKKISEKPISNSTVKQSFISVEVSRVDKLMDLVGELVVAESMVVNNPELLNLELNSFSKASRQLRLVINEIQDIIMAIRMVPLTLTFQKMARIIRDMKKKIGKEVVLELLGEETEVDKNVIEKIADPLMHIIRNSMDHGIENVKDRRLVGKSDKGKIILSAKHSGGNVIITIKDDGRGLNKKAIYEKAVSKSLIVKPMNECSEKEIFNMILNAGFSTKESVTEFSGRGVGMDVVMQNIESIGGSIVINSEEGVGTEMSIIIPLTLAIIDGMMMRVGNTIFSIPIMSIKESFIVKDDQLITDPDGNEILMIRGKCYPLIRLNKRYDINNSITNIEDGIVMMIEHDEKFILIFADELIGEQQVVVKSLSRYISKIDGVSGFALLGDGKISLILDPSGLMIT